MPSSIKFLFILQSSLLHFQVQVSVPSVCSERQVDMGLFKINYCRIPVVAKLWSPQVNLYREGSGGREEDKRKGVQCSGDTPHLVY